MEDRRIFPEEGFPEGQMKVELHVGSGGSIWIGDEMAGYYILREHDGITDMIRFAVLPEFRSRGVGRFMLACALQHATTERIVLHVKKTNRSALRLYTRENFQICGEILGSWVMCRTTSE